MTDSAVASLRDAYVNLLKRAVLGETVPPTTMYRPIDHVPGGRLQRRFLGRALQREGAVLAHRVAVDISQNEEGRLSAWDLPPWPLTMIGACRLANVEACMQSVLEAGVPGDFIETGVWKGGTTIFMRGFLRAHDVTDRRVYVADSFRGLPEPDLTQYPADQGLDLHLWPNLAIGLEEVKANFARFGLLDGQVEFVDGWFRDTLPDLRGHPWSVIRLDADMYESTIDALRNLYDGLAPGGWLIIDDYQDIAACRRAVDDFRDERGVKEPIVTVDWSAVCWQKQP